MYDVPETIWRVAQDTEAPVWEDDQDTQEDIPLGLAEWERILQEYLV